MMDVEDVIELGSSDEEAEPPAAKKIKPLSNAMVHIPNKIRDVTISPLSSNKNKLSRKLASRASNDIPIVTVNDLQSKPNGRCLQKLTPQPPSQNLNLNTKTDKALQIQNRLNSCPLKVLPSKSLKVGNQYLGLQRPRVAGISPRIINSLPPSITVTKTQVGSSTHHAGMLKNKIRVNKQLANTKFGQSKTKSYSATCLGGILTVELDDDEKSTVDDSGPAQWYMRPEEQLDKNKLEEQNNTEPKVKEIIEITIEDSPVKPCLREHAKNVNDALSITIEDSPVRVSKKPVNEAELGSDTDENMSRSPIPSSPHSKKKLDYPETEKCNEVSVEMDRDNVIESEPKENRDKAAIALTKPTNEGSGDKNIGKPVTSTTDLEPDNDTTQKDVSPKKDKLVENINKVDENATTNKDVDVTNDSFEFHSTFQEFMDLCLEIDKSEEMKTIVEKRIKTYIRQVPKEFVESEQFIDTISIKITLIKSDSSQIYLHIKDIVDELKLHRRKKKITPLANENNPVEDVDDINKYDRKRRSQIRKLEKTLKKLERAINKLDEQEVDFDDEEDSVYLLNDRYKERYVHTYAKLCQLTDTKMLTEPHVVIECRPGQPPGPAKKLEKWINKKVPIGSTLPFPDFHDVIKCVRMANAEDKLGWNDADIENEARDLFTRCGKKLQRRRQENEWRVAVSRITQAIDPAEKDETLKKKLDENKENASKKETEVLNKYVQKQNQLHLEPIEIDDNDADNSPVESDDEVDDESDMLEDSQKRKDRLQRLIDEKESKKNSIKRIGLENETESKSSSLPIESKEDELETIIAKDQDVIDTEKSEETVEKMETDSDLKRHKSVEKNNVTNIESVGDVLNKDTRFDTIDYFNKEQILSENVKDVDSDDSVEEIYVSPNITVGDVESNPNEKRHTHNMCDDFYGDELNLLVKLNSGNETSSSDSSDLDDSPIAISDSLDSHSESENYETYDIISVGNSSCSDTDKATSGNNNDAMKSDDAGTCNSLNEVKNKETKKARKSINDITSSEDESENLILAYSDEEGPKTVHLQDDSLTLGETFVGSVENEENIDKGVESKRCEEDKGDVISKGENDKTILIRETNLDSVEIGNSGKKAVDLKDPDNLIEDGDDGITNNSNSCVDNCDDINDESLSISEKSIEESIFSDVNKENSICNNNGDQTCDVVMAIDNNLEDVVTNEKQSQSDDFNIASGNDCSQIQTEEISLNETPTLHTNENQDFDKYVHTCDPNSNDTQLLTEINTDSCGDISYTCKDNEKMEIDSGVPSTMDTTENIKSGDASEQVILETIAETTVPVVTTSIDTSELNVQDASENPTSLDASQITANETSGDPITMEANPEPTTLDNLETSLLEDSTIDKVEEQESKETVPLETSEKSTLAVSEDIMDQGANTDAEAIIFDEDVEPIIVEVGEEQKSGEDDTETMSPRVVDESEISTSGVNNNVSSSIERVSSVQRSASLEHTFNMVEMMLDKLFNSSP